MGVLYFKRYGHRGVCIIVLRLSSQHCRPGTGFMVFHSIFAFGLFFLDSPRLRDTE